MPKVIKLEKLKDGNILAKDIYINSSVLFRTGMLITSELINYLKRKKVPSVAIFDGPSIAPFRNLFTPKSLMPAHERKELTERFQNEMTQIADELRYGRILHSEASYRWLHSLYLKFYSNPTVRFLLDCLKQWDPICYIHSLDVFVLTSLYFKHVHWPVSQEFLLGCLLHDIGKLYTPIEILLKTGKLTQREYEKITQHPVDGYQLLEQMKFPEETCRIARSHHERLNGSGYPDHLHVKSSDRDLKLMMIVDVYSALTLIRSYRKPMHTTKAMQIILNDSHNNDLFDLKICYLFINFIHIFPPATRVLLTNGDKGIILANSSGSDILPHVKLENSGKVIQLPSDLSVTVETITSWDSREMVLQAKQTWNDYIKYLIDGDSVKAVDCLDALSDGMRIEDVFVKLFERSLDEVQKGWLLNRFVEAEYMVAAFTILRLLSWKMLKITHQLPNTEMGKIVIANLESFNGLTRTKLMDDLFTISGWKTDFLPEISEIDIVLDQIQRKQANYLAVLCTNRHSSVLFDLLKHLRSKFPNLMIFILGNQEKLAQNPQKNRLLVSTNLSELITNMKPCLSKKGAHDFYK
ncbi:HD domain-containing protein [Sporolactobacillus shoreicorticis]|uniref:HD-GYP domain-containing protein n=1 Tax=Sporolactobacillus shoreicorticis TaxID=1923877 RepID=A0ABW5RZK5_9BACL|nr:HD domain-containing phosphohydrolase [Sporolactobacillus shoreicorticis]MCO7124975.1 HD domain-containing protein [Sporolactobacillus shoreicorticis]